MFSRDYLPTYGSSHKIQKQKILERMKAKFTREQFLLLPKHVFNTRNLLRNGIKFVRKNNRFVFDKMKALNCYYPSERVQLCQ